MCEPPAAAATETREAPSRGARRQKPTVLQRGDASSHSNSRGRQPSQVLVRSTETNLFGDSKGDEVSTTVPTTTEDSFFLAPLRCPRCHLQINPVGPRHYRGCPNCAADGVPVNPVCDVPLERTQRALSTPRPGAGMWRFGDAMPVDAAAAVTLGEGDTPLVELPTLAEEWGIAALYAKNEAANPTWSHKDRLVSTSVTAARQLGARVVTAASTGNHGAAVAAYAARAGLGCVIVTRTSVPATMKALMQSFGALVVAVDSSAGRYEIVAEGVDRFGWYPLSNSVAPPVGSSPYGIDGYKTIAYELWQQFDGRLPKWLVMPVAYGDCLAGVARGFIDLVALGLIERAPRLVAAERFGALAQARATGTFEAVPVEPTEAFSIGGAYTTAQAVTALDATDGTACTVDEPALLAAQEELAQREGLLGEAASCVAVAAVRQLRGAGVIAASDDVAVLLTSSGLKAPESLGRRLPQVQTVEPRLEDVQRLAREQLDGSQYAAFFSDWSAS